MIPCDHCNNFDASPNYYPCCSSKCMYEYNNLDYRWIKFEEEMPKLNQKIDIKFDNEEIFTAKFQHNSFKEYFVISYYHETGEKSETTKKYANLNTCKYWRPIKEKRPDFNKLRCGDLLAILYHGREEPYVCFFQKLTEEFFIAACYKSKGKTIDFTIRNIKKITRINLEKQTFEEI